MQNEMNQGKIRVITVAGLVGTPLPKLPRSVPLDPCVLFGRYMGCLVWSQYTHHLNCPRPPWRDRMSQW